MKGDILGNGTGDTKFFVIAGGYRLLSVSVMLSLSLGPLESELRFFSFFLTAHNLCSLVWLSVQGTKLEGRVSQLLSLWTLSHAWR